MPFRREEACSQSWNFFYLAYLPSGFYVSPKSTLPNGGVYVAISAFPNYPTPHFSIWLICQVDFMSLPKSTLTDQKRNSGIGQPGNFYICGQLEAHLGSSQGEWT